MSAAMLELTLLHRDPRIAVFAKPSGLLVHRGWADDACVAMDLARDALGVRVHPLHRLDRGTSGVLAFALDVESAAAMGALFESGEVEKTYVALVRGFAPASGLIDHPVPKGEDGPRVPAITAFRRLAAIEAAGGRWSIVEARPQTGRLHQIRRHMKHIAHPIVGDVNYGKGDINRLFRERFGLHRLALHAVSLAFVHPFTRGRVAISAPLPDDLRAPFAKLGVHDDALAPLACASCAISGVEEVAGAG